MPRCEAERSTMSVWYSADAKESCRAMYMPRLRVHGTWHVTRGTWHTTHAEHVHGRWPCAMQRCTCRAASCQAPPAPVSMAIVSIGRAASCLVSTVIVSIGRAASCLVSTVIVSIGRAASCLVSTVIVSLGRAASCLVSTVIVSIGRAASCRAPPSPWPPRRPRRWPSGRRQSPRRPCRAPT